MNETPGINAPARLPVSDALLDLDETDFAATAAEDVVLDLDDDVPLNPTYEQPSWDALPTAEPEPVVFEEDAVPEQQEAFADDQPASAAAVAEPAAVIEPTVPEAENAPTGPLVYPPGMGLTPNELSPDAINAIARRVIELMSDQVVREIAWQVVPELSELMIRKKLEQE